MENIGGSRARENNGGSRGGLIREVFDWNFKKEEGAILWALSNYTSVALETEYPGFITETSQFADEVQRYRDMKWNVERTKLIQVGLTIFNPVTAEVGGVWQFNLSGFDPEHDVHSARAIEMLRGSGINFRENNVRGVRMWDFISLLNRIRHGFADRVEWVTFHGLYDVAYLVAALDGGLPENMEGFRRKAGELLFRGGIFDLKCMARHNSWMGLEKLAAELGAAREEGCAHQAGSDSLLTAKAFVRALQCSLVHNVNEYRGRLYGMTLPIPSTGLRHIPPTLPAAAVSYINNIPPPPPLPAAFYNLPPPLALPLPAAASYLNIPPPLPSAARFFISNVNCLPASMY